MNKKLAIDVSMGETVRVNGPVEVTLLDKSGKRARLQFIADETVKIQTEKPSPAIATIRRGVN